MCHFLEESGLWYEGNEEIFGEMTFQQPTIVEIVHFFTNLRNMSGPVHFIWQSPPGGGRVGVRAHLPRALRTQVLSAVEIVFFLSSAIN